MKRLREFKSLLGVLAALVLWEAMSLSGVFPRSIFPPPQMVLAAGIREFQEGLLLTHIGVSMARLFAGFLIGSVIGVLLGILMGWVKWVENLFNPLIEIVRPVPPLAWIPLAIFWFGIGEVSKLFMISLAVFFFVVVNTYKGVANVDFVLIRASQSLDATRRQVLFQVILPATMPVAALASRAPTYTLWLRVAPDPPFGQERTGGDRSRQVWTFKQAQIRYTGGGGGEAARQLLSRQVLSLAGSQPRQDREEVPARRARLPTR